MRVDVVAGVRGEVRLQAATGGREKRGFHSRGLIFWVRAVAAAIEIVILAVDDVDETCEVQRGAYAELRVSISLRALVCLLAVC